MEDLLKLLIQSNIKQKTELIYMTDNNYKNKILKERANNVKHSLKKLKRSEKILPGLEFLFSNEKFVIELIYISEVILLKNLTPLPSTPEFILGIINIKGKIISVINIKKFFNQPSKEIKYLSKVIVVNYNKIELGILVDEIIGITDIELEKLQLKVNDITLNYKNFTIGITEERGIVLDIKKILLSERLIINDKV